ncbi:hypothetical protein GLOTRDRAFT_105619 [Gloeophyllum trabeum ATCC 11539]|uniref:AB hydrolase-1 domain-containing protein n=1 Tax=Gloeophyllum trabeum (strain ATCC 11539 / FP-39264 / Madison 617) TaxID=670483 RepID=S7Q699_GLOTA|nr:uncharacterized protein GLOTRDRAFT_105619 [Gloeophyllum trabeum ATCC 11539]EPQ55586.1 hypothetical protein GLOTRDRAFT_105619 [Gloeophyllum trabeum ATCC 11539]
MASLLIDKVVFNTPLKVEGVALRMAVNRYCPAQPAAEGVTLLLAHASGTHKEHWEPFLERLYELQGDARTVREAWAFDWHTHGDSGVLNSAALRSRNVANNVCIAISHWAEAIAAFVESHLATHRLVAIGHSAGTSAVLYSTKCYKASPVKYEKIILVEPALIDRDVYRQHSEERGRQIKLLTKAISAQKSKWESRSEAYEYFSKRPPWKLWDERARTILVNHGLRVVGDGSTSTGSVATKCEKRFEATNYDDLESTIQAATQIEKICAETPIHVIFGEISDLVHPCLKVTSCSPRYSHETAIDTSKGRNAASITRIPEAGHMVVQQRPDKLAEEVHVILRASGRRPRAAAL